MEVENCITILYLLCTFCSPPPVWVILKVKHGKLAWCSSVFLGSVHGRPECELYVIFLVRQSPLEKHVEQSKKMYHFLSNYTIQNFLLQEEVREGELRWRSETASEVKRESKRQRDRETETNREEEIEDRQKEKERLADHKQRGWGTIRFEGMPSACSHSEFVNSSSMRDGQDSSNFSLISS